MDEIKQLLRDAVESSQEDIMCLLDGASQQILDNVCQIIVDRFGSESPLAQKINASSMSVNNYMRDFALAHGWID